MNRIVLLFDRRWRRIVFAAAVLIPTVFGWLAQAQQAVHRPASSNRWLIIVETSRSMESRAEVARRLAAGLVARGMEGQLRPGDTVGLWTFNDTVQSGQFPLQLWMPDTAQISGRRVYEFLQGRRFERGSRPEKVMTELEPILKDSQFITVILITDGSASLRGTPFDEKINAQYKEWQEEQKKRQMPFLTVLRAKGGVLTDYVVNTPPFPLELPALPAELAKPKPEPKVESNVEARAPKPTVVAPLILSGKKPQEAQVSGGTGATNLVTESSAPDAAAASNLPQAHFEAAKPAEPLEPVLAGKPAAVANVPLEPVHSASSPSETKVALGEAPPRASAAEEIKPESSRPGSLVVQPAARVQSAVVEPERSSRGTVVWVVVAGLAVIVLGGFFLQRRLRQGSHVSLITRSLDRER